MQAIKNELNVFFDCDDTLVMWSEAPCDVYIQDPYSNGQLPLKKHKRHIKLLKDYKQRGYSVVVWSAGGAAWAEAVVNALELNEFVDYTMAKPLKYVDDLTAPDIMGTRIYLKDEDEI